MKVVIVDFQSGNLFSVKQALHLLGVDTVISTSKKDIENADAVILPGVGSFGDAMKNLEESDLITPLKEYISSGKPFLGICLGMQLLLSESEEAPGIKGLDMIPGKVVRFRESVKKKVPHIGWSRLRKTGHSWENSFFKNLDENDFMYFVIWIIFFDRFNEKRPPGIDHLKRIRRKHQTWRSKGKTLKLNTAFRGRCVFAGNV